MDIQVDYKSAIPVYEQIKRQIKLSILNGLLSVDEKLCSVREMARITQVNQNTVIKAYYQLEQEGFIYSRPGKGYFISQRTDESDPAKEQLLTSLTQEYLNKALSLGFSIDEIIGELNKLSQGGSND